MAAGGDADLQRQLEALFAEELQDNLRVLRDGLAQLEDEGFDGALVRELFRAAHSLKGAAHSASVLDAIGPCHRLESRLAEVRDDAEQLDRSLLAELDRDLGLLIGLERRLQASTGAATAAPAPAPDAGDRRPPTVPRGDARARVEVGRLDRLVERSAALLTATHGLRSLTEDLESITGVARSTGHDQRATTASTSALAGLALRARTLDRHVRAIADEVAETAQDLRLQPFHDVTAGLDHAVRELCRSTGTDARLVVEGGDIELDRDVGDALREPLLHLVRNAVDHGIEAPEQRRAAGKAPTGTVTVSAAGEGSRVLVTVRDDGAGVDVVNLTSQLADGDASVDHDDMEIAFTPGLSTADTITEVSGRGIGLDAARARVESLGGTLHLHSDRSAGTEVTIRVPRSLAVLRVMIVDAGCGELVGVPVSAVTRLHRVTDDQVEHVEGRLAVVLDDGRQPAVHLAAALSLHRGTLVADGLNVAVGVVDGAGVLLVQRALTELDVVLRPLPARVGAGAGLLGGALLPSGAVALVVNPSAALRNGLSLAAPPRQRRAPSRRHRVLLAEDTLTTRALERSILESAGYEVVVAVDGVEALECLREDTVDAVVSDIDMPRMGGIELCRAIRSSVHHSDVPVILVTSLGSEEDRRRGLDAGANAYLVKTAFDQTALLDAVGRFL